MTKIKASELYKSLIKRTEEAFMFEMEEYEKEIKSTHIEDEDSSIYKCRLLFLKFSKIQAKHLQISLTKGVLSALCDQGLVEFDTNFKHKYKELAEEAIKETHDYWDQYFK